MNLFRPLFQMALFGALILAIIALGFLGIYLGFAVFHLEFTIQLGWGVYGPQDQPILWQGLGLFLILAGFLKASEWLLRITTKVSRLIGFHPDPDDGLHPYDP